MEAMSESIDNIVTDGGGVRGLSAIRILKNVMGRINTDRPPGDRLQPWQVFDMIGGTSTGGIIAIMLGRLRMKLEDCEEAYLKLSKSIFTPRRTSRILQKWDFLNANGKFDGEILEKAIKDCIKDIFPELSPDVLLKDQDASCKTFVVAVRETNSEPAILRSYKNPEKEWLLCDECTIWQACRATSAATTFFDPIRIGKFGQRFIDGGVLYNNPIRLVALEAAYLWPEHEAIILNVGTGSPMSPKFAGNLADIARTMSQILTRTENTYNEFFESHQEMTARGLLFRFSVVHGLEDVGLDEYNEFARIVDATDTYLDDPKTCRELKACAEKLSGVFIADDQISSDESQRIKNSLSPINFFVTQHDMIDRYQEGTGRWFFETSEFQDWISDSGKTLLCPGRAGAGKTTLSSMVIEHLRREFRQNTNIGVAWIYCDYKHTHVQTPVNLIAGIWRVLLDCSVPSRDAKKLYQSHSDRNTSPRLREISELLQSEVRRYSRVFIVVDALDECLSDNHTDIILAKELLALKPRVNLMVTGRSLRILRREFGTAATVEIIASADDIQSYVMKQISEEPRLTLRVSEDSSLREDIVRAVLESSKGMFLIAFYQMKELARKNTVRDVRRALVNPPGELDDFYHEAIRRIESQNQEDRWLADQVLLWVSCTVVPLTVDALLHALAVEPGSSELDQMNIPIGIDVDSLCAGLIVVDHNSKIVRFVHSTAQSYFHTIRSTRFPEAQASIATGCLTYLLFDAFAADICTSDEELEARLKKYPLLEYAARHWGTHSREAPEEMDTRLAQLALRLFDKKQNMLCAVQAMLKHLWFPSLSFIERVNGLHIAAEFGLGQVVRLILVNAADVNSKDGSEETALHIAAQHGHVQVVEALLEHTCIKVNLPNFCGETPLLLAARAGHQDVVELLVQRDDVLLDAKCDENWTPLLWALHKGHEAVARELLSTGRFTANSKDKGGRTPLSWAAEKGLSAAVHWLLAGAHIDIDSEDNERRTPLFWATHGSAEVMRQLLKGKAQINKQALDGSTALHEAVKELLDESVVLLLQYGADAEIENTYKRSPMDVALFFGSVRMVEILLDHGVCLRIDRNGNTPLHAIAHNFNDQAIRLMRMEEAKHNVNITWINNDLPFGVDSGLGRYDEMVRLLVTSGVDIEGWNEDGRTPLQTAIIECHEILVEVLLNHQADVDAKDRFGATPLHLATYLRNDAMVQILLKHHANIEAEGRGGRTPLYLGVEIGDRSMVEILLENGANVNVQCRAGIPALHMSIHRKNGEITKIMLDKGADINAQDNSGLTALHLVVQSEDLAMMEILLKNGADFDNQENSGLTALHLSVHTGNLAMTELLMENGADINIQNDMGWTVLHLSVFVQSCAMMEKLLENGADIDKQNHNGQTALHLATFHRRRRLISVLLDEGVDILLKDKHGMTAWGLANMFGPESIQLVLEATDRSSIGRRRLVRSRYRLLDI